MTVDRLYSLGRRSIGEINILSCAVLNEAKRKVLNAEYRQMAQIRYIVLDVEQSIEFYTSKLGFELKQQFGPAMAIVSFGDIDLWLAGPQASASKPMLDGAKPLPGGWARFVLPVTNLDELVPRLLSEGIDFKSEIVVGPGGRQALCVDPSGNVIELFEISG
jgi:catechol 2,3-dioxygenase-like lactoylglutathione lyase family enzyme